VFINIISSRHVGSWWISYLALCITGRLEAANHKGGLKKWAELQSWGNLMKWPIFSTDRVSLLHCVDCACVLRRLYGLANGGRREALARDSKTIFHYKSLNTNWGKGSTVLVLFLSTFHYLDITSPEPPLSHLFDLFFPEVIEIYWACAE
jgi:hypothetical protein